MLRLGRGKQQQDEEKRRGGRELLRLDALDCHAEREPALHRDARTGQADADLPRHGLLSGKEHVAHGSHRIHRLAMIRDRHWQRGGNAELALHAQGELCQVRRVPSARLARTRRIGAGGHFFLRTRAAASPNGATR